MTISWEILALGVCWYIVIAAYLFIYLPRGVSHYVVHAGLGFASLEYVLQVNSQYPFFIIPSAEVTTMNHHIETKI